MNLSENLKKIRKDNHLSQEQLAEKLGVSRQSVSKWESELAYPDLDKIMQISTIFHIPIDDLLNHNIEEVINEKQSIIRMNRVLDSFLSYLAKTIDMFSSMKLKSKIKCIFEQIVIVCILFCFFLILASIGNYIINGLTLSLPQKVYELLWNVLASLYTIFAIVLGTTLELYIFKIRYLDYYEIINSSDFCSDEEKDQEKGIKEESQLEDKEKQKIVLEKKKEKIIIRNPEGKDYKFIKGLLNITILFIKFMIAMLALGVCMLLVFLVTTLVCTFLIIKTGLFFLGLVLSCLALIVITWIGLQILIHFIINRKSNKKGMLYSFLSSLVVLGIGIGLTIVGFTKFQYIENLEDMNYKTSTFHIKMRDNLVLDTSDYDVQLIEENREDIQVEIAHNKILEVSIQESNSYVYFHNYYEKDFITALRNQIEDINQYRIIDYSKTKISIFASHENLEILRQNQNHYDSQEEKHIRKINYYLEREQEYEHKISQLEEDIFQLKERNQELENRYQED